MNWWLLKRQIHPSWLIAVGCGGVYVGVFLAQYYQLPENISTNALVVALIIAVAVFWRKSVYLVPPLIIAGMLLGLWRGSISQFELEKFRPSYGKIVLIQGVVKDDVDIDSSGLMVIRLSKLIIDGNSMPGALWVTASGENIKRGDELVLSGKLKEGFGTFSGVIYRADLIKVIHPSPGDIARMIRDWFADAVRKVVPEPESSLGIGYLVGQRRALPADLVSALQTAGLTHIVVASGYNLTILVRLARRLFEKISKYLSALSASAMIVAFIAITGASPSMARAGLVAGLSLAAWYYGRRFHPIVLLFIAIAVTLLINPSYAWGDLGWQLSFTAFAGVMIIAPLMQRYLFGDSKPGMIRQILGETVSAQMATAPILIASFGQISNVALVTNLLVLPLVPFAMLFTFAAGIGSLILPAVAWLTAMPAAWLLRYMVFVAEYFAGLPWAVSAVRFSTLNVLVCYAAIVAICIYMWRVTKFNLRQTNLVE